MLDRRTFVAATVALGLSARSRARGADVDVAIIGAGVAGLTAAKRLNQLGRSFVVLEARGRIGGRAWTDTFMDEPVDRGAHWLHSAHINPLAPIARRMGVRLTRSSSRDEGRLFASPGVLALDAEEAIGRGEAALERMFIRSIATTADVPLSASITSETALAARLIAFAIGEEPADISAIDVAELESGDDLAVGGGLGAFVRQYGSDVPVQLNAPVDGIEWHTPGCVTLSGSFGTLRARSCLITVPPGVLAADGAIRFDPALPDSKQVALQHLPMSSFVKVALRLTRPLTELPLYSVDAQRFEGGSLHALHHSPGSNIATLMLGGMAARELMDAGEAAAIAEARSVLAALVGADATAIVRDGLLCEWRSDAFARGAYAFVRPGTGTPRIDYAASIADRLFFAGDTAGGSLAMTVGGAYQSARDAATAIHRVLDR